MALMFIPTTNVVPIYREGTVATLRSFPTTSVELQPYTVSPNTGAPTLQQALESLPVRQEQITALAVDSTNASSADVPSDNNFVDFIKNNAVPVGIAAVVVLIALTYKPKRRRK